MRCRETARPALAPIISFFFTGIEEIIELEGVQDLPVCLVKGNRPFDDLILSE